eukprot:TRINITY_DN14247_c0_g1_i2.p1 TRINITY_DN14247_c0_g1~~TRINITY_DN14247_c0_g1_i2.p1  ORF type:complete len:637 (+),score=45.28 TRINITY_DN14247_c0_g1_i2:39-1913(+)
MFASLVLNKHMHVYFYGVMLACRRPMELDGINRAECENTPGEVASFIIPGENWFSGETPTLCLEAAHIVPFEAGKDMRSRFAHAWTDANSKNMSWFRFWKDAGKQFTSTYQRFGGDGGEISSHTIPLLGMSQSSAETKWESQVNKDPLVFSYGTIPTSIRHELEGADQVKFENVAFAPANVYLTYYTIKRIGDDAFSRLKIRHVRHGALAYKFDRAHGMDGESRERVEENSEEGTKPTPMQRALIELQKIVEAAFDIPEAVNQPLRLRFTQLMGNEASAKDGEERQYVVDQSQLIDQFRMDINSHPDGRFKTLEIAETFFATNYNGVLKPESSVHNEKALWSYLKWIYQDLASATKSTQWGQVGTHQHACLSMLGGTPNSECQQNLKDMADVDKSMIAVIDASSLLPEKKASLRSALRLHQSLLVSTSNNVEFNTPAEVMRMIILDYILEVTTFANCKSGLDRTSIHDAVQMAVIEILSLYETCLELMVELALRLREYTVVWSDNLKTEAAPPETFDCKSPKDEKMQKRLLRILHNAVLKSLLEISMKITYASTGFEGLKWSLDGVAQQPLPGWFVPREVQIGETIITTTSTWYWTRGIRYLESGTGVLPFKVLLQRDSLNRGE